jgi:hypothetical protein
VDLWTDFSSGQSYRHIFIDGIIAFASVFGLLLLWRRLFYLEKNREKLFNYFWHYFYISLDSLGFIFS